MPVHVVRGITLSPELSLPVDVVTETMAILAKRRAGKSYTARRLVEQLLDAQLQVVIVDPKGDWWGLRSSADGKRPGYPILIAGGEHADVPLEVSGGEVLARFVVDQRVSLLLDLSGFRKREVATFMAMFLETLYRLKAKREYQTPVMLVLDEADAIAPQHPQDGEQRMLGAAEDIVRRGGQRGIGCTLISQRSAVLNKNVLTQAQILVALRTMSPQDLAALDAWVKVHGSPEERGVLFASLPSLPVGDAWVWSPGWPTVSGIFQRIHVDAITTFDSGRTPKVGERLAPPKTVAEVDLGELKTLLAGTIVKARADDPKVLRAKITELERAHHAARNEWTVKLAAAELAAKTVPEPDRTEVPVLTVQDRELLVTLRDELHELSAEQLALASRLDQILSKLNEQITPDHGAVLTVSPPQAKQPVPRIAAVPRDHRRPPPMSPAPRPERVAVADDDSLTVPQMRILEALDRLLVVRYPNPLKSQVAVLAGQSPRSSGFENNLSRLSTRGYVERLADKRLSILDAGRELLPAHAPATLTRDDLHQAWFGVLKSPKLEWMMRVLIEMYPATVSKDTLATMTSQSVTSSGFENNLSALSTWGLLARLPNKEVVATEGLFPAELAR